MKAVIVIVNTDACSGLLANPERFCSAQRLEKCSQINNELVRSQGYAAELALSYALSGDRLERPVYSYKKNGKPVISNGYISLSHSGKYAVCAYSDGPVGIDLEVYRSVNPSIGKRVLSERELSEYGVTMDKYYILTKYVMKEAYLKLTGEGISGGLSSVEDNGKTVFCCGKPAGSLFRLTTDEFMLAAVTRENTKFDVIRLSS